MLLSKRQVALLSLVAAIELISSVSAYTDDAVKQFSYVRPWTVMKRLDGTCFAAAQASQGDFFVLNFRQTGVAIALVNSQFHFPVGEYPVGLALHGSDIQPADTGDSVGIVEKGRENGVTLKLQDHQIRNFPKAALMTVTLAGKDHLLFLSDTASMMRDLVTCAKYDSDPLKSAR